MVEVFEKKMVEARTLFHYLKNYLKEKKSFDMR
jgi:hypothetical protein